VEFEVGTDEKGKPFADKVTSADGTPIPPPDPARKRNNKKKAKEATTEEGGETKEEDSGESTKEEKKKGRTRNKRRAAKKEAAPKSDWYSELDEDVQKAMEGRSITIESGRVFLSVGDARMKVGTGGYITLAHSSGLVAEGTYISTKEGKLTATWDRVLKLEGEEWKTSTVEAENGALLKEIDLKDGT
jgi:type IV secretory pathway VirB10-like protein